MSSLSKCLKKMGLSEHEGAILRGEAGKYMTADGIGAQEAAIQAVEDYVDQLTAEREDILAQITAAGGMSTEPTNPDNVSEEVSESGMVMSPKVPQTPEFKAWFGDGVETRAVYHGSPERFGEGANTIARADRYRPFWVTPSKKLATEYSRGGSTAVMFTNIKKPANLKALAWDLLDTYNNDEEMLENNPDAYWDLETDGNITHNAYVLANSPAVMDLLASQGYDSLLVEERRGVWSYGILSPENVKLTTNERPTNSPDISQSPKNFKFSPDLRAEIDERVATANEDESQLEEGEVVTAGQILREMIEDMDDKETVAYEFRKELQDFGITAGIYRGYTKEQLDQIVSSGGRKYSFKRGKMFYVFDSWDPLEGGEESASFSPKAPDTPEFKAWFGEGVEKRPVYHGSPERFGEGANTVARADRYRPFWVTPSKKVASEYARGGSVTPLYTNIKKPANLTAMAWDLLDIYNNDEEMLENNPDGYWDPETDGSITHNAYILANSPAVMDHLVSLGYDSVTVEERRGIWSYGILSSEQIKSTANNAPTAAPDINQSPKSSEFRKWFAGSKVVDAKGEPLVVYHGTAGAFDTFDPDKAGSNYPSTGGRRGFFFTSSAGVASVYAEKPAYADFTPGAEPRFGDGTANIVPVYLRLKNPLVVNTKQSPDKYFDYNRSRLYERAQSHDGIIVNGAGRSLYVAFEPEQIKSVFNDKPTDSPNISQAPKIVGESRRAYTPEQRKMFQNVGRTVQVASISNRIAEIRKDFGKKLAQGLVDQFAPLKDLSKQAYTLARLSKGSSGAFEAMLHHGKVSIKGGAYDADMSGGFVEKVGIPLHGEMEDFLWWVAANRAERLSKEDRERLFTKDDIIAGKSLASGTTSFDYKTRSGTTTRDRAAIFADALKNFDEFNRNALDMAEQSGLIDSAARQVWEHEFYVPFYRVSEEDGSFIGAEIGNGLVRQRAFKALRGGGGKLNSDLLANALANWAHLLDAGAKNRASREALEAAQNMGVALEAGPEVVKALAKSIGKRNSTVWFMDGGQQRHFLVDDPYVLAAITSLDYAGMSGPLMDALSTAKHWITVGVTASPAFKVRNLIRDSVQAIATSELGYNPVTNLREGIAASDPKSQTYVSALASGGLIRFGTMLEGRTSDRVRQLVRMGVKDSTILDSPDKLRAFYDKVIEPAVSAYNELGNRSEEINRAALFKQLTAKGMPHAEAALMARDLMDFSLQGSWTGVRFLSQVVPFLNARMQGLYKLGRAAKEDPKKFTAVLGATAMLSLALLVAYSDDDDWKKREDWDRDNFWWFKFGGTAFRIPKPFEIGAMGTLAERGLEYFTSDEMTGERFRERTLKLLSDQLSMNPTPQLFKPILDVYSNKDSFNGRPIESMSMEKLQPDYRFTSRTSMTARAISTAGQTVTSTIGADFLSPVQIDHMVRGYLGWLGSFVVGTADLLARPASGEPDQPDRDLWKVATQNFVSTLPEDQSRYVSHMYEQARVVEQAYGTYRQLLKEGKVDEAREFATENQDKLAKYRRVETVKRTESQLNERIRMIERSSKPSDEKRELITRLNEMKDRAARAVN